MQLDDDHKEIIKLINKGKSASEILQSKLQFELKYQDISKIHICIKHKEGCYFTADFNYKTGIVITQKQSDELNKQISFINNLFSLLETNGLIKVQKKNPDSYSTVLIKENNKLYIKDIQSECALTKFEEQNIVPSKYFSKFARTFRTHAEEKKYRDEKFDKFRNGNLVWVVLSLCVILSTVFTFLGIHSCSPDKTQSETNETKGINRDIPQNPDSEPDNTNQDLPQIPDSEPESIGQISI